MDFSFLLPGFRGKSRKILKETNRKLINNIFILRDKLTTIGYNLGEVDYMIKTSCNGVDINELDANQLQKIETKLEAQLFTAKQCLSFVREAK